MVTKSPNHQIIMNAIQAIIMNARSNLEFIGSMTTQCEDYTKIHRIGVLKIDDELFGIEFSAEIHDDTNYARISVSSKTEKDSKNLRDLAKMAKEALKAIGQSAASFGKKIIIDDSNINDFSNGSFSMNAIGSFSMNAIGLYDSAKTSVLDKVTKRFEPKKNDMVAEDDRLLIDESDVTTVIRRYLYEHTERNAEYSYEYLTDLIFRSGQLKDRQNTRLWLFRFVQRGYFTQIRPRVYRRDGNVGF